MLSRRRLALVVVAALVAAGCSGDDDASPTTTGAPAITTSSAAVASRTAPEDPLAEAEWSVQPGSEQVAVLDAPVGEELELVGDDGSVAASGTVDELGSLLFRDVPSGRYTVRGEAETSTEFEVVAVDAAPPPASFYAEQIVPTGGYGYLRDARRDHALRQRRAAGPARRWPVSDGRRVLRLPAE